jgi:ABC-2 type transport system permease protein
MRIFKTVTRVLAVVGKELVSIARRPGALFSLVLGPFLIMALFGLGYSGYRRPLDSIVVIPQGSGLPTDPLTYQNVAGEGLHIVSVTSDEASAMADLDAQRVDVVVVAPADIETKFQAGQRTQVAVRVNQTDPIEGSYMVFLARGLEAAINRQIITTAAAESEGYAIQQGATNVSNLPPDVIAAPAEAVVNNVAPSTPTLVHYFGPAVLA